MKVSFKPTRNMKKPLVVFELIAETDAEAALLAIIFDGPRWFEMNQFSAPTAGENTKVEFIQQENEQWERN